MGGHAGRRRGPGRGPGEGRRGTDSQQTFLFQAAPLSGHGRRWTRREPGPRSPPRPPTRRTVGLEEPDQFIKKSEREKLCEAQRASLRPRSPISTQRRRTASTSSDVPARRSRQNDHEHPLPDALWPTTTRTLLSLLALAEVYRWMMTSTPVEGPKTAKACFSTSTRPATYPGRSRSRRPRTRSSGCSPRAGSTGSPACSAPRARAPLTTTSSATAAPSLSAVWKANKT